MAPLLSKIWHRSSSFPIKVSPFINFHPRYLSSKPQLTEVYYLASCSSSSKDSSSSLSQIDGDGFLTMDDFIHRLMIQKSTPDWLPFRPGSSFYVPPHNRPLKAADFFQNLANQLTDEESLALVTSRGWPYSKFFFPGAGRASEKANFEFKLLAGEMEMKVKMIQEGDNIELKFLAGEMEMTIQEGDDVDCAEDSDSDSEDLGG